jgi:iron complex outermembrane receptor protein
MDRAVRHLFGGAWMRHISNCRAAIIAAVAAAAVPGNVLAQQRSFNVPAGPATRAIPEFARQAGVQITAPASRLRGRRTQAIKGVRDLHEALTRLLEDTGLRVLADDGRTITLGLVREPEPIPTAGWGGLEPTQASDESTESQSIIVTGTRIRGAMVASPTIRIDREDIARSGHQDLGEVIRAIPQNFSGGQNPTITLGTGDVANQNANNGSGLNLRGLGPDATLTLVNGNRLAFGGFAQSIDISAVPLGAVERLEIVTDGSSAIYGADAVAGVANVITRRNFKGLETGVTARGATGGGLFRIGAAATAGLAWTGGGALIAYDFQHDDGLESRHRRYLGYMDPVNTVYPPSDQHSLFVNIHQTITGGVTFDMDALYLERSFDRTAKNSFLFLTSHGKARIFSIAPSLEVAVSGDWALTVTGTYGSDQSRSSDYTALFGNAIAKGTNCYCNKAWTAQVSAAGTLFALPAGNVGLAAGGGYRNNRYDSRNQNNLTNVFSRSRGNQPSRYGFAEIFAPLVGPEMGIAGINRLNFTAAARYEDYSDFGSVTTPKIGLVYEPISGLRFKGSWGRSFKAPTLVQQLSPLSVSLSSASSFGATGLPATASVLFINGNGGTLRPERARTWTATAQIQPDVLPGLSVELTYFDVSYTDRIVQPVDSVLSSVFGNADYAQYLLRDPTPVQQAELIARAPRGISRNETPYAYNPANVIGIIYNNYTNVAREQARGFDLNASYVFDLFGGRASGNGSASWLRSDRQNRAGAGVIQRAGIVFNPAKFRARGALAWSKGGLTMAGSVNVLGRVVDDQQAITLHQPRFTTVDATLRYRMRRSASVFSDLEAVLILTNLFDRKPPLRTPAADYATNFDSTNYSATGRLIGMSLTKHW